MGSKVIPTPSFLTRNQFASAVGVSLRCLDNQLKAGSIRHLKIGKSVRIPETELTRLTRGGDTPPPLAKAE